MNLLNKFTSVYGPGSSPDQISQRLDEISKTIPSQPSKLQLETCFSLIDLTSLNTDDNEDTARRLATRLNDFEKQFPDLPSVAAVCVYPPLVGHIRSHLEVESIQIAAVGAGFPSSQTFLSVKLAECELLVSKGADEIDIVISVGDFMAGKYQRVADEISLIKNTIGKAHLKVILETGLLKSPEKIRLASLLAMEAGADFIKTSTGKLNPAATPEAVLVMAEAIADYHRTSGRVVGLKPAGGIASPGDALTYLTLVEQVLGTQWISPHRLRFGASRLANQLLTAIQNTDTSYF